MTARSQSAATVPALRLLTIIGTANDLGSPLIKEEELSVPAEYLNGNETDFLFVRANNNSVEDEEGINWVCWSTTKWLTGVVGEVGDQGHEGMGEVYRISVG